MGPSLVPSPEEVEGAIACACAAEERLVAELYARGDPPVRIAQLMALSRHRVRAILNDLVRRHARALPAHPPGQTVIWQALDGPRGGVVEEALTLAEREQLWVRADQVDRDWHWVRTADGRRIVKLGDTLRPIALTYPSEDGHR